MIAKFKREILTNFYICCPSSNTPNIQVFISSKKSGEMVRNFVTVSTSPLNDVNGNYAHISHCMYYLNRSFHVNIKEIV
jgi:hypothetical protein